MFLYNSMPTEIDHSRIDPEEIVHSSSTNTMYDPPVESVGVSSPRKTTCSVATRSNITGVSSSSSSGVSFPIFGTVVGPSPPYPVAVR